MKYKLLILGKLPPPYMGPSIAFQILINSGLKNEFNLDYLDVAANENLSTLGKWSFKKIAANLSIYLNLAKKLKNNKPDIVLIPISQTGLGFFKDSIFIIICSIFKCKVMIQLRGSGFKTWIDHSNFINKLYVKQILKLSRGVIVLGENLRYLFQDYFSPNRIFVVPNGGDYSIQEKKYEQHKTVKIIYLANLQKSKGIEDVIEALVMVNKALPNTFEMTIIGEWRNNETKVKCLGLVETNKLPVTFYSSAVSKNKFDYLLSSDIFVFTPREPEGHPWVIVEAMASGLPIISTDQGAIVESVINEENGYIVPANSPNIIAEKIVHLISYPELRIKMGKKSRMFYEEKFTEKTMVNKFSESFKTIIENE